MAEERKKRYYSISEVADMMGVKQHILRYWESEFSMLRPRKNRAGNRAYTERDIQIVQMIRHLLYDEKYTIEGAKRHLKGHRDEVRQPDKEQLDLQFDKTPKKNELKDIRDELAAIREMVKKL